jgi:hypothetical protein
MLAFIIGGLVTLFLVLRAARSGNLVAQVAVDTTLAGGGLLAVLYGLAGGGLIAVVAGGLGIAGGVKGLIQDAQKASQRG